MNTVDDFARSFPELPRFCDQTEPGIRDDSEWRDWTAQPTTPDQLRIEDYLDTQRLAAKSILHVGIGNSGLAKRFCGRTARIVGTSIVCEEVEHARALALPGYEAALHNKYAGNAPFAGRFDFIVDNNPTTFCCCLTHLHAMLRFYADHLAEGGQIVTDRVGLGWSIAAPGSSPRWGFTFEDIAEAARSVGLTAFAMGGNMIVLGRARPEEPGVSRKVGHLVRKAARRFTRSS